MRGQGARATAGNHPNTPEPGALGTPPGPSALLRESLFHRLRVQFLLGLSAG